MRGLEQRVKEFNKKDERWVGYTIIRQRGQPTYEVNVNNISLGEKENPNNAKE